MRCHNLQNILYPAVTTQPDFDIQLQLDKCSRVSHAHGLIIISRVIKQDQISHGRHSSIMLQIH
eukprot:8437881-Ditylum_brightwellii.AAC.1